MGDAHRWRSWRSLFSRLRDASTASSALEDLLAQPKRSLPAAAAGLPPKEVAEDIIFLVQLILSEFSLFFDRYDFGAINKLYSMIVEVNSYVSLAAIPAYFSSVVHFLESVIYLSLDAISNMDLSKDVLSKRHKFITESLQVLGQFVHDHGDRLMANDVESVAILILDLLKCPRYLPPHVAGLERDLDSERLVFVLLGNLLIRSENSLSRSNWTELVQNLRTFLESMTSVGQLVEDSKSSRFYTAVLRCIQLILSDMKGSVTDHVAGLVRCLCIFFTYGLNATLNPTSKFEEISVIPNQKEVPSKVYKPPHLRRSSERTASGSAQKASESLQNTKSHASTLVLLSDSEHSDSDGSIGDGDRFKSSKARALAILSLHALARADPKTLHAHWILLFPDHDVFRYRRSHNSLLSVLLSDPVLKVRMAAASTISVMLEGPSRAFMQIAEYKEPGKLGSFTTLSSSLGQVLVQLQRGLTHMVLNETNMGLLVATLKALSLFLAAAPFSRLPSELLPNTIIAIQKRLKYLSSFSSDQTNSACMALNSLGCAFNTVPTSQMVSEMLSDNVSVPGMVRKSLLLDDLLDCTRPSKPSTIRVEALQALKTAVHNYPDVMMLHWTSVSSIMKTALRSSSSEQVLCNSNAVMTKSTPDDKVLQAVVKLLNEFLRAVSGSNVMDDLQDDINLKLSAAKPVYLRGGTSAISSSSDNGMSVHGGSVAVGMMLWNESLTEYLPDLTKHYGASVRAEALNCFAGLTHPIFSSLTSNYQDFITSSVLWRIAKDDSPSVRSAACRAVGVLISFPELVSRNDVLACAMDSVMQSTTDMSIAVRITSSWALANICDALRNATENDLSFNVEPSALTKLAECAIKLSKDNDKVRANAVRALGNLARFIRFSGPNSQCAQVGRHKVEPVIGGLSQQRSAEPYPWLEKMVQTLVSCITTGNVKVQWNACHALGNLFLNKSIFLPEMGWVASVYSILLLLLRDSANFKIRIQAAAALSVPDSRIDYGVSFYNVIPALVLALDSLDSNQNLAPSSFKYMDALREQLTSTFLHVLGLSTPEDFESLQDFLLKRGAFLEMLLKSTYLQAALQAGLVDNETMVNLFAKSSLTPEKLPPPPKERIWYAINDKENYVGREESLYQRKEDIRRVITRLIEMYRYGNQASSVHMFEQLLDQLGDE